jgi:hypothetical protein
MLFPTIMDFTAYNVILYLIYILADKNWREFTIHGDSGDYFGDA